MKNAKVFLLLALFWTGWGADSPANTFPEASPKGAPSKECVILLHGLGRSRFSMSSMARYLAERGYETVNVDYPSTKKTINAIIDDHLLPEVTACQKKGAEKIHVVTHSLGGIVIRCYLQDHDLPKGSRVVMLAPPNHGSEIADFLKGRSFFNWLLGPSLKELGTDKESLPNRIKPVTGVKVGVIAGATDPLPLFGSLFSGPNDGKVSVESAKLMEMKAFKTILCGHTFIMNRSDVMEAVDHFLRHAAF